MNAKIAFGTFAFSSVLLTGCVTVKGNSSNVTVVNQPQNVREYSVQSVMWQQNAAEYRALCYQAFNLAKLRLDQKLALPENQGKKLAIITDIDETVMDNSPYSAQMILDNHEYTSQTWKDWVNKAEAKEVPGATAFLNYAKSKGVEVFYVSNRKVDEVEATIKNMLLLGFPFADKAHIYPKTDKSSKKSRFDEVAKTHKVLLYMGDNLSDFKEEFHTPSTTFRNQLADKLKNDFGVDFIALPNPMYGDWENRGIYQGRHDWTEAQKDSLQKASLKGYK